MKFWISALNFFGHAWLTLGILFISAGIVEAWQLGGFSVVQKLLSPFNVLNWLILVVILVPSFGALMWVEKLEEKQSAQS